MHIADLSIFSKRKRKRNFKQYLQSFMSKYGKNSKTVFTGVCVKNGVVGDEILKIKVLWFE